MINFIYKSVLSFVAIILFYSCGSSTRFTKEESTNNTRFDKTESLGVEIGDASFYSKEFNGSKTSSGEIYDMNELTAAHPSYPFNTIVKVTNIVNNKSVVVRINDRMPNFKGRIIDLSLEAAKKNEMINIGIQKVKIEVIEWGKNKKPD